MLQEGGKLIQPDIHKLYMHENFIECAARLRQGGAGQVEVVLLGPVAAVVVRMLGARRLLHSRQAGLLLSMLVECKNGVATVLFR